MSVHELAGQTNPHPEPQRDQWGRPQLPDPDTGKIRAWTRATTHAKTVADMHALTKWQLRMVAQGLVMRPDIYAATAAADSDKKQLDRLCDQAKEAAAASAGATMGSSLHTFTEKADMGEKVPAGTWTSDINAYTSTMQQAGITIHRQWIERLVIVPSQSVAGTFDRIVTLADGRPVIADLKTGKDLSYSWGEIAIQLALYSRGVGLWDGADGYDPMPTVDQNTALVMHLPVGQATCTLYEVDIDAGWAMAEVCGQVRHWRRRRNLASPLVPTTAPTYVHVEDAPPPVEKKVALKPAVRAPGKMPPWHSTDNGQTVPVEEVERLRARLRNLDQPRQFSVHRWMVDSRDAGRPWANTGSGMSQRTAAIANALLCCLECLHDDEQPDDLTRAALGVVVGGLKPTWLTGAVFGSLSISEAMSVAHLAQLFAADDPGATTQIANQLLADTKENP